MNSMEFLLANCNPSDLDTSLLLVYNVTDMIQLENSNYSNKSITTCLVNLISNQHFNEVFLGCICVQFIQPYF